MNRKSVNMHEAKTNLSKLVANLSPGDEVLICNAHKPVAKLVPTGAKADVVFGVCQSMEFELPDDFDEMTSDELKDWYGENLE